MNFILFTKCSIWLFADRVDKINQKKKKSMLAAFYIEIEAVRQSNSCRIFLRFVGELGRVSVIE